uniref:Uncharacterized protein n=1 Tax=Rhizophora mucronata TaxID=61149 RepID=A0A2P2QH06_RHIMU
MSHHSDWYSLSVSCSGMIKPRTVFDRLAIILVFSIVEYEYEYLHRCLTQFSGKGKRIWST